MVMSVHVCFEKLFLGNFCVPPLVTCDGSRHQSLIS
jgi:hypothetical protein